MKISELKARKVLIELATGKLYKVSIRDGGTRMYLVDNDSKEPVYRLTSALNHIGKQGFPDYDLKGFEYA